MPAKLTKRAIDALQPTQTAYDTRDTETRGLLLRVEKTGLKAFFLDYRFEGAKRRHRIGGWPGLSVEGARVAAGKLLGDIAKGIDPRARKKAEAAKATKDKLSNLGAFLKDRYEDHARAHMKSHAEQLRRIRSDFADRLDKPMTTLTTFWAEGLRRKWVKDGKAAKTINRDFQRIEAVLARATEWGVLAVHPLADFKPLKVDETGRVRYLSADEEARLRDALVKREERMRAERMRMNTWRVARHMDPLPAHHGDYLDHLRPIVLTALNTGMRRGELFGLRWDSVNLQEKWLHVKAATSKSGQSRDIPLNDEALAVLTAWQERQTGDSEYVFPGADGKPLTTIKRSWNRIAKEAKLKNFKFHDLRHSFASRLVQSGVDLNTVRQLLGHKDIETTQIYAHLDPDNLASAVKRVAR